MPCKCPLGLTGKVQPVNLEWGAEGFDPFAPGRIASRHIATSSLGSNLIMLGPSRAVYECLRGGLDVKKDDENVKSHPFMRWRDRLLFCAKAIIKAQAEIGEIDGIT